MWFRLCIFRVTSKFLVNLSPHVIYFELWMVFFSVRVFFGIHFAFFRECLVWIKVFQTVLKVGVQYLFVVAEKDFNNRPISQLAKVLSTIISFSLTILHHLSRFSVSMECKRSFFSWTFLSLSRIILSTIKATLKYHICHHSTIDDNMKWQSQK